MAYQFVIHGFTKRLRVDTRTVELIENIVIIITGVRAGNGAVIIPVLSGHDDVWIGFHLRIVCQGNILPLSTLRIITEIAHATDAEYGGLVITRIIHATAVDALLSPYNTRILIAVCLSGQTVTGKDVLAPFVLIVAALIGSAFLIEAGIAFDSVRTKENAYKLDIGCHIPANLICVYYIISVIVSVAGQAGIAKIIVVVHCRVGIVRVGLVPKRCGLILSVEV